MSADSSWELQQAIYTALTGDSALMAMITGVHDHVPQGAAFPYVTIGEAAAVDWRTVGHDGMELTLVLHVWSRERGRQEAKQVLAEIHRILRSTGAQAKLTIGQPNDKYEQEADRVADQVMSMPDPKPDIAESG